MEFGWGVEEFCSVSDREHGTIHVLFHWNPNSLAQPCASQLWQLSKFSMEVTEVTSGAPLWTEHYLEAVLKNDVYRNAARPSIINVAAVVILYEPTMNQNEYVVFDYLFWVIWSLTCFAVWHCYQTQICEYNFSDWGLIYS